MTKHRATPIEILITCEHGGNFIPPAYRAYFANQRKVLESHRGHDAGALPLANRLAGALAAPLFSSTVSRLLIELNRSPWNRRLYSEFTKELDREIRQEIMRRYYLPYRSKVESYISHAAEHGRRTVHISSHSFTPELNGEIRNADIGLLYDPARPCEKIFCGDWKPALREQMPELVVRTNYPYRGNSDGLPTYLRRQFDEDVYIGVELEVNQKYFLYDRPQWRRITRAVVNSVQNVLENSRRRIFTQV
ncbi:MAG: N-formylglutamate amidohydrolase [Burkholderiales bacterium]|nr:N-formylglutamate amidohydrolase [Burkholderiales bacterium]